MVRQAQAYLEHRQALGFDLQTSQKLLPQFAKFLDRSNQRGPLTVDLILRWVHLPQTATNSYKANRLSVARGFARYLAARDGQTEVPGWRLLPQAFYRRPYVFSERQLEQLLVASGQMKPSFPLRPLTYRTLFGLLASTGLRSCEALKLPRGDVDLEHGILRIELTKFRKSRLVPLHPTTTRALASFRAISAGLMERNPSSSAGLGWHYRTEPWCGPFVIFVTIWDGVKATADGLVRESTTCAIASHADASCIGAATTKTSTN